MEVTVDAVTQGIRSFTTLPYVFTTLATARTLLNASPDQSSYTSCNVAPGTSIETVRAALSSRLPDAEILTHAEFRKRSLDYWLFETGAGSALIAGAALGIIVGIVIVAQTLYASTKDHLNEFATLRALGASAGYINKVILMQAVLSALIGYLLGMVLSMVVIWASPGLHAADRHDAGPRRHAVRPDRRHVRARCPLRHLQSCPHRSGCRVQPLTSNGRLRP